MSYPLAIFTPQIGARSETFIGNHLKDLLPGRTAAIARATWDEPPFALDWAFEGPLLDLGGGIFSGGSVQHALLRRMSRGLHLGLESRVAQRFLRKHQVVVAMGEYLDFSREWLDLASKLGIRTFGHAHGYDVSMRLRDPSWRRVYREYNRFDGIITVSETSKVRLTDIGIEPSQVHVIPCGVRVPPEPPERKPTAECRCLFVGRVVPKKGPMFLLEAFRRAATRSERLHLDFVGDGPLLDAVRQFVIASDLETRVRIHGGLPNSRVREMMKAADLFVQHSITDPVTGDEEGLPVGILEAMAAALPVVATMHAGIPEAICDPSVGVLVEESDVSGMAHAILALADDPTRRAKMGRKAWLRARDRYSWEREKSGLTNLLQLDAV